MNFYRDLAQVGQEMVILIIPVVFAWMIRDVRSSECGNNRISVFETNGTFLHHITGNNANGSNLNGPWGLAFDQSGNLHIVHTNTSMIKVFTPED